jgi:hypothetical protein
VATPNTLTITPAAWATPVTVSVACSAASTDRPLCADGTRFCTATANSAATLRSEVRTITLDTTSKITVSRAPVQYVSVCCLSYRAPRPILWPLLTQPTTPLRRQI